MLTKKLIYYCVLVGDRGVKEMSMPNGFTKIGEIGVDSGTIVIVDPCYIKEHHAKEEDFDGFSTSGIMKQVITKMEDTETAEFTEAREDGSEYGLGVFSSTGWGDGSYNVYAKIKSGRVMGIYIDFEGEEEEEGEEQDPFAIED